MNGKYVQQDFFVLVKKYQKGHILMMEKRERGRGKQYKSLIV